MELNKLRNGEFKKLTNWKQYTVVEVVTASGVEDLGFMTCVPNSQICKPWEDDNTTKLVAS